MTNIIKPKKSMGSDPAFFSVWDMHAYYGESLYCSRGKL